MNVSNQRMDWIADRDRRDSAISEKSMSAIPEGVIACLFRADCL